MKTSFNLSAHTFYTYLGTFYIIISIINFFLLMVVIYSLLEDATPKPIPIAIVKGCTHQGDIG